MSPSRGLLTVLTAVLVLAPARADGVQPGSESEKRKQLLERLGLEKKKQAKPKETDSPSDEEDGDPPSGDEDADRSEKDQLPKEEGPIDGAPAEAEPVQQVFTGRVHRALRRHCGKCHAPGGSAGSTGFSMSGSTAADYRAARKFVKPGAPQTSPLLAKGSGKGHLGGSPLKAGSSDYKLVQKWIAEGAVRGGGGSASPAPPAPAPAPAAAPSPPPSPRPSASSGESSAPAPPAPTVTPPPSDAGAGPTAPPATAGSEAAASVPSATDAFGPAHRITVEQCKACHAPTAMAGSTRFVVTGDIHQDLANAKTLVQPGEPSNSPLLAKGAGQAHGGGAVLPAGSSGHETVAAWIRQVGAQPASTAPVEAVDAKGGRIDATTGASPTVQGSRLGDGTPLPAAQASPSPFPVALPFHLRINGKFDFSYERRNFKNHPFSDGDNAFQTYHHFLFLSRSGAKDPFGFNIELMTQQFYEFNARVSAFKGLLRFLFKAGKIMVPFGPEPLFHKSYGGRTGFDQQILPVVWAQPGIAVNAQGTAGPVLISNDLYAIQGYALRSADAILNLQGDVSGLDNFKVGLGDRLGMSVGPLSAWYSFQFNALGFDQLLFVQAFDLEFWRWHGVPVLQNLVVGLGGMRADVSGGENEGDDYYHFGSYGWIGYYPIRWLYLQYRAGLRTIDNRRGLYFDESRVDERDSSSHNVTVTGRYKGFYTTLQWFWNLEKANEQDDDFLRMTVGYEF